MYLLYFILHIYKATILFKHSFSSQAILLVHIETVTQQKRSYPEIKKLGRFGMFDSSY